MPLAPVAASVLICTYNRASLLRETLESLAGVKSARAWEVVIVDNNSTDDTRTVVEEMAVTFPAPLLYVFEPRQGKSHALNTGLDVCRGQVIVFTDDDVHVAPAWADAACASLAGQRWPAHAAGAVRPSGGAGPTRWLDQTRGDLWGTLPSLDYRAESFIF